MCEALVATASTQHHHPAPNRAPAKLGPQRLPCSRHCKGPARRRETWSVTRRWRRNATPRTPAMCGPYPVNDHGRNDHLQSSWHRGLVGAGEASRPSVCSARPRWPARRTQRVEARSRGGRALPQPAAGAGGVAWGPKGGSRCSVRGAGAGGGGWQAVEWPPRAGEMAPAVLCAELRCAAN